MGEYAAGLASGAAAAYGAFAAGIRRPPRLSVREWADAHRRLPTKGASEPGRWRTARVPYAGEIMDVLSEAHPARRVVFMKSAQVAGTEIGLNWLGWFINTQKAPFMAVQPTTDLGERFSKQRLAAMIDDTAPLRALIQPARSRDSGNTTAIKQWPGGVLVIAGANSAASLRSMPARYVFCDETDAYPADLDGEGDPVALAEARTATFPRRKIFLCSTPTIESLSRINREWLASDMRRYCVPCPECGAPQPLRWENLHWPEGEPKQAAYACAECGALIGEHHKTEMLAAGRWVAEHPEREIAGFHISGLYTPLGLGLSWAELAAEWETVRRDPVKVKTFMNTRLGECYSDPEERLDWEDLKSRAEPFALRTVPAGCLLLTAGVDVQKDRLEVQVLGHGRHGMTAVLDWHQIQGDPTRPEVWATLDRYRAEPLRNAWGMDMRISMTAIDCGFLTDEVLNYARARRNQGVIAVKGASTYARAIIGRPSKVDLTYRGQTLKHGAEIWQLGVDTAKHTLFARLNGDRKVALGERLIRFSEGLPEDYFLQLTAEIFDPNKRRWVKQSGRRNEALDTFGYALAAAMHPAVRVHVLREPQWARLEAALQPGQPGLFDQPSGSAATAETPAPPTGGDKPVSGEEMLQGARNKLPDPPRAGWVTRWKSRDWNGSRF